MADVVRVTQRQSGRVLGGFREEVSQRLLQCKVARPFFKDDILCLDDSTHCRIKEFIGSAAIVPNQDVLD